MPLGTCREGQQGLLTDKTKQRHGILQLTKLRGML